MRVGWGLHSSPRSSLFLPQSSMLRDQMPTLIWTSQYNAVNYWQLQRDQMVNHFTGIGAFTTKVRAWRHQECAAGEEQGWRHWVQH